MRGAGWSRVTHPFATLCPAEAGLIVRLACVKHAASVHPEPGSNSPFEIALIQKINVVARIQNGFFVSLQYPVLKVQAPCFFAGQKRNKLPCAHRLGSRRRLDILGPRPTCVKRKTRLLFSTQVVRHVSSSLRRPQHGGATAPMPRRALFERISPPPARKTAGSVMPGNI